MNEKKERHPAIKMKKRRNKKLETLRYNCIPKASVKTEIVEYEDNTTATINPNIKPNGNGIFGDAGKYYRDMKFERIKYLNKHYKHSKYTRRRRPWYYLTKGICKNYETRNVSWGEHTTYWRTKSEMGIFNDKYTIPRFTREELVIRLLDEKVKKWVTKHPYPNQGLFYEKEMPLYIQNEYDESLRLIYINLCKKYLNGKRPERCTEHYYELLKLPEREFNAYRKQKQDDERKRELELRSEQRKAA